MVGVDQPEPPRLKGSSRLPHLHATRSHHLPLGRIHWVVASLRDIPVADQRLANGHVVDHGGGAQVLHELAVEWGGGRGRDGVTGGRDQHDVRVHGDHAVAELRCVSGCLRFR